MKITPAQLWYISCVYPETVTVDKAEHVYQAHIKRHEEEQGFASYWESAAKIVNRLHEDMREKVQEIVEESAPVKNDLRNCKYCRSWRNRNIPSCPSGWCLNPKTKVPGSELMKDGHWCRDFWYCELWEPAA